MKPTTLLYGTLALLAVAAPVSPQATFVQVGNDLGNHSRLWGADRLGAGFGAGEVWLQGSGARHAVRWSGAAPLEDLGDLPGGLDDSSGEAISDDGSVLVGGNLWSGGESRAFLWDAAGGIRSLQEVLEVDHGLDLGGFVPWVASAISADGLTITGYGVNHKGYYRGFVATLLSPCPDPESYCSALPNSSGAAAAIGHGGTTSISGNSFTLIATGGVPSQFGLFYFGPNRIQLPLGDGYRCVGGGINRLNPAFLSDAAGTSTRRGRVAADSGLAP